MFRPMLAGQAQDAVLRFPLIASPKLDGLRCLGIEMMALSRSLKTLPNGALQDYFTLRPWLQGLDGELVVGPPNAPDVYNTSASGIMSRDGSPDWTFYVFDRFDMEEPFWKRHQSLTDKLPFGGDPRVAIVPHVTIHNEEQLIKYEAHCIKQGFEGVMLRDPGGPYKQGRSTAREGWLLKLKRFMDAEAEVIGFEELQHNQNIATTDNLGLTKRSSHKENQVGGGVLGALVCRALDGTEFNIGSGFTAEQRQLFWLHRDQLMGKPVTFKYFPHGVKEAPRHPVFKAFRHPIDLGE